MNNASPPLNGVVTSGYGGFYQVLTQHGTLTCKSRGRLKQSHDAILTGDHVRLRLLDDDTRAGGPTVQAMIEEIEPRANTLTRPHIANVGQAIIVLSWRLPDFDLLLLDKMLLMCRLAGVACVVCFNKSDLMAEVDQPVFTAIRAAYEQAGCRVIAVSAARGENIGALRQWLSGQVSVLAGPSGVGKSSLLNLLVPGEAAATGAVSERLLRGKHTTRYVRLLALSSAEEGGMLADSPGFFVLDPPEALSVALLPTLYPEYARLYAGKDGCRFDCCRHDREPDCAVRRAAEEGRLDQGRYRRYLRILHEIQAREVKYR